MKNLRPLWLVVLLLPRALAGAEPDAAVGRVVTDLAYLAPDRAEKLDLYLPAPPAAGRPGRRRWCGFMAAVG